MSAGSDSCPGNAGHSTWVGEARLVRRTDGADLGRWLHPVGFDDPADLELYPPSGTRPRDPEVGQLAPFREGPVRRPRLDPPSFGIFGGRLTNGQN